MSSGGFYFGSEPRSPLRRGLAITRRDSRAFTDLVIGRLARFATPCPEENARSVRKLRARSLRTPAQAQISVPACARKDENLHLV